MTRPLRLVLSLFVLVAACGEDEAPNARKKIREEHVPAMATVIRDDIRRHIEGVQEAARRLAPGFVVEDPATRERQLRTALKYVQEPPRGVPAFIVSPMSFLAAVGTDGKVIARDADPDRMKGLDFAREYPVVRAALREGRTGYDLGEFAAQEGGESSFSILFAAPARRDGQIVGAVVAGIPLWRLAQRMSRQLQVEHAGTTGLTLWAYMYKGDRLFHFGTPPELDEVIPDAATRRRGLERSPKGFTGHVQLYGRVYGYGVVPTPVVGEDVGMIIFRADPE